MSFESTAVTNIIYINALSELLALCEEKDIEVKAVKILFNGFQVFFHGTDGDAVIHDQSYFHEQGCWETCGFPWDRNDVSILSSEDLVERILEI